jgi:hypothetical protein
MKIALLHGAVLNAGDFLIRERTKALLMHFYPDCVITDYCRNYELDDKIDEINQNDIMIFAGGPCYNAAFGLTTPIVKSYEKIKIPIMIIGSGWWGSSTHPDVIYNFKFDEQMHSFLSRVESDSKILGCRDFYSVDVLAANGFFSGVMTGCPAWYSIPHIGKQLKNVDDRLNKIRKICLSDCGNIQNKTLEVELATFLRKSFGDNVEIIYVNHRDYVLDKLQVEDFYKKINVKIVDISGSANGFSVYDSCDLHIGFRVHAHIYNLSRRNISILIEEDSRGAGVNDAFGLPHICSYKLSVEDNKLTYVHNNYLCTQVGDVLSNHASNNFMRFERAFENIDAYYNVMAKQIQSIKKLI